MQPLFEPPPLLTADLPGLGGQIKCAPEDFIVEEIPAYLPSGQGGFLYLWIEKRDLGAEFFIRQVAKRLGLRPDDTGTAGLKDRRAVTRQWVSVPVAAEAQLAALEGDGIRVLQVSKHGNKLKPGHLRGNRFEVRIRGIDASQASMLPGLLDRLRATGLPNFYGPQRFGKDAETLRLGLRLMGVDRSDDADTGPRPARFLRKLALSAVQSALFNSCLAQRMADGLLHHVLLGDVMGKWPAGGLFVVKDLPAEQARFDRREIVHTGPMFGRKMMATAAVAAEREAAVLTEVGLTPASFHGYGKLLEGTRRHNLIWIDDLSGHVEGNDAILRFTLPAGSYATVLLHEVMKGDVDEEV
jgi:tRNA pseudouridine13 synthase